MSSTLTKYEQLVVILEALHRRYKAVDASDPEGENEDTVRLLEDLNDQIEALELEVRTMEEEMWIDERLTEIKDYERSRV